MKQYYIATLEIVVDDKNADLSNSIIDPISKKILFDKDFDVIGLINLTYERQKTRFSFRVRNGTLKKHARDLYDYVMKYYVKKQRFDEY